MSNFQFNTGQHVLITSSQGHLQACNETTYQVGANNRLNGIISVNLLKDGRSVGAIAQDKLKAAGGVK